MISLFSNLVFTQERSCDLACQGFVLNDHSFDSTILVRDLQMPGGMDGWETLKQMRQIAPAVRVVILTGSTPDQGLEELVLKEGAIGLLTKPIQIDELAPKIRALIRGEKP